MYFRRESNAAFTLSGFDDQERNLTFVKTAFQVLKLQFELDNNKVLFYKLSVRYLVVKPACVNAV